MKTLDMFKLHPVSPQSLRDRLRSGLLGRAEITGQGQAGGATKLWLSGPRPGMECQPQSGISGRAKRNCRAGSRSGRPRTKHQPAQPGCHRCCNMMAQDRGGGVTSQSQKPSSPDPICLQNFASEFKSSNTSRHWESST